MDGATLLRQLRQLLDESSESGIIDDRTSYDFLYEAACAFADRTLISKSSQSITVIAGQDTYDLNGDYLKPYAKDRSDRHFVRYTTPLNMYFPTFRDYGDILANAVPFLSDEGNIGSGALGMTPLGIAPLGGSGPGLAFQAQEIPNHFSVIADAARPTRVTGSASATSDSDSTYDEPVLTVSSSAFTDVWPGDVVHNVTDESDGVVVKKTSTTELTTTLFGGNKAFWTSGDTFVIQPASRYKLILYPIPSTSDHVVSVPYVAKPAPVYSKFGSYAIPDRYDMALLKYAAFLYKYKDRAPNFGDAWYRYWDDTVRKAYVAINGSLIRGGNLHVNLMANT